MNITQRLLELDPTLTRHIEGQWDKPFDPLSQGFSSFNDAGIEVETGEFLYAFTRMLKPMNVLETGTHIGVGAAYMGTALKDNHMGHLETIEFIPEIHQRAQKRIFDLNLVNEVTCRLGDVAQFTPIPGMMYKLILLDTEPQTRFAELIKFFPYLEEGGFVFIHDLHRGMHQGDAQRNNVDHPDMLYWPYGALPDTIKEWVKEDKLRPFHFSTPRGLTGFYRPHPEDYKW